MTIEEQTQFLKDENKMKTEDEKKSSGVAKAGLITGTIGTALGVLAGGGNGLFGGGMGNGVSQELADTKIEAVANTANTGIQSVSNALACLTNTVNQLSGLTKLIIPHDSICPPGMFRRRNIAL